MISAFLCAMIGTAYGYWAATMVSKKRTRDLRDELMRLRVKARRYVLTVTDESAERAAAVFMKLATAPPVDMFDNSRAHIVAAAMAGQDEDQDAEEG